MEYIGNNMFFVFCFFFLGVYVGNVVGKDSLTRGVSHCGLAIYIN